MGDMQSIWEIIRMISATTDPDLLPILAAYPINQPWIGQYFHRGNIQITKFVPDDVMVYRVYLKMSHKQRMRFVLNYRAFDALWKVDIASDMTASHGREYNKALHWPKSTV